MRPEPLLRPPLHWVVPLLASVGTGVLLILCYPRFDQGSLAWVALIPLALVCVHSSPRASLGWGYLGGAVFFLGSLPWLVHVTRLGWVLLSLFLALYVALWAGFLAVVNRRWRAASPTIARNVLLCFLGACAWVAVEIVRTHLLTGFPWNLLGVSQHQNLALIQFASVTGVYGVSWLLCFVNLALALTLLRLRSEFFATERRPYRPHVELILALLLVVGAMTGGLRALQSHHAAAPRAARLDVAVVQPNIPQDVKWEQVSATLIYERLERLTLGAAHTRPDLIIWPETATPEPLLSDPTAYRIITNAVRASGAAMLVGSMTAQARLPRTQSDPTSEDRVWYNSAYFITAEATVAEPYHKQHLVPFGEFVPLADLLPFMKYTTPIPGSLGRGRDPKLFEVRNRKFQTDGLQLGTLSSRFGVVICFEDVFPDLFRRFVGRGAQFMVNITNDAWYKESAGAYQHMANSVFRAVENRVGLVRCANTGYSCFIDAVGRVTARVAGTPREGIFVQGFRTDKVRLRGEDEPLTFYTRHGDVFAWGCFAGTVVALLWRKKIRVCPPEAAR